MAFREEALQPARLSAGAILGTVLAALLVAWLLPISPQAALAPILLATLLLPLLHRPHLAPAAVLLCAPLFSGMERGAVLPYFRANEIILILVFLGYLITVAIGPKRKFEVTFVDRAFLIFLLARSVLPLVVHPIGPQADPTNLVKFFFAPLQYFLLYRLVQDTTRNRRDIRVLMRVMILAGVIVAGVGLLQALRVPAVEDLLMKYYPSNKPMYTFLHSQRVTSLFGSGWNVCAFYLSQTLLLALVVHPLERPGLPRAILTGAAILMALVMMLSFSFSTTITLIVALIFIAHRKGKVRVYLARLLPAAAAFAVVVVLFFGDALRERMDLQFRGTVIPITLLIRLNFWSETLWPLVKDSLLLGIGPANFTKVTAESEYIYIIATCGLVGLAGFIGFAAYAWRKLRAAARLFDPATLEGSIAILALAFFLQNLISSTSGHYFEYSGASETLWGTWGLLLVCLRIRREESRTTTDETKAA